MNISTAPAPLFAFLLCALGCLVAAGESPPPAPAVPPATTAAVAANLPAAIVPGEWLVLPRVGDYQRAALHTDPIEAAVARGDWKPPRAGDAVAGTAWRADAVPAAADLAGGYAYAEFQSPTVGVMLLDAPGGAAVCLNGEWVPGDPYASGWFRPPVAVREGTNRLLVHLAAPTARPTLAAPPAALAMLAERAVVPDVVEGDPIDAGSVGSIPLVNATDAPVTDAVLSVRWEGQPAESVPLRWIGPRLVTPVTFTLPKLPASPAAGERVRLIVEVQAPGASAKGKTTLARAELTVAVVGAAKPRTQTFVSAIDASVQPYGVTPASSGGAVAVQLALHDAGQTHRDCLAEYGARADADVVAPLGRGPWAFDWEDWSRLDALEALDDYAASRERRGSKIDPGRVTVVGRGAGGHGALVLATLSPERWAGVGAIDPWTGFTPRRAADPAAGPLEALLARSSAASDPLGVIENLAGSRVSVLLTVAGRGAVSDCRALRQRLGAFHDDFAYREAAPTDDPAASRAALLDGLHAGPRPTPLGDVVAFATPDVGALSRLGWVTVLGADRQGEGASVSLRRDAAAGSISGATSNVRRLRLDLSDWAAAKGRARVSIRLDNADAVEATIGGRDGDAVALARDQRGGWTRVPDLDGDADRFASLFKSPARPGGFKTAFRARPILAFGTRGSEEEQRWSAAKARYDAHLFLYRGAGLLEVVPDTLLVGAIAGQAPPGAAGLADPGRSVVVYGARHTNAAWALVRQEAMLRRSEAVRVESGRVWFGERPESGGDLAVVAVRPRPGSRDASIGVVGGSGPVGMRLTTRLRYFWSGIEYPDFLLFGPAALAPPAAGRSSDDVRAAGWFDADWGTDSAGVLWRDRAI